MQINWDEVHSPLFDHISQADRSAILGCIGYHIGAFQKGEIVAFDDEYIRHIGIVLSGSVDMIKEDLWGNKTMLVRMRKDELFGETFACGEDNLSVVTFIVSENAKILFLPFNRVMHSCSNVCSFHHQLIENMVHIIANKNRDLMRKLEVISKKTCGRRFWPTCLSMPKSGSPTALKSLWGVLSSQNFCVQTAVH